MNESLQNISLDIWGIYGSVDQPQVIAQRIETWCRSQHFIHDFKGLKFIWIMFFLLFIQYSIDFWLIEFQDHPTWGKHIRAGYVAVRVAIVATALIFVYYLATYRNAFLGA